MGTYKLPKRYTVYLPDELAEEIEQKAQEEALSVSSYMRSIIVRYHREHGKF